MPRSVQLIVLVTTAAWCPECMGKMAGLGRMGEAYEQRGVFIASALYQDTGFEAADAADALQLRRRYSPTLNSLADPDQALRPYFQPFGRNKIIMIDARTMSIVSRSETYQNAPLEASIREWLDARN